MAQNNPGPPQAPPPPGYTGPAHMDPDEQRRAEHFYNTINSKISMPQWQAWAGKADSGCPPDFPFRTDKKVSGGDQNECVETPDNCPHGTTAFGKDQCIPVNDKRIQGGSRPGSPGGPGGNMPDPRNPRGPSMPYPGGPQGGMYNYSGPDDVWGISEGGGDYGLAGMYQGLLGNAAQSQSVLAPQIAALQKQKEGQVKGIMASVPPGGQRDRALRELDQSFNQSLSGLRQGLVTSSMGGLQSLYGTQLDDSTKRWLGQLSSDTSRYGIDQSTGLGYAELGEKGRQFDVGMDWDQDKFGQQIGWDKDKYGQDLGFRRDQFAWEKDQAKQKRDDTRRGGIGNIISGIAGGLLGGGNDKNGSGGGTPWWKKALGIGAGVGGLIFSDARTKENVEPFLDGMEALKGLSPMKATYNGKAGTAEGEEIISIMAQELEEKIPSAVKKVPTEDFPDTRMIAPLTILMTSVNATKELERRIAKLERKRK